MIISKEIATYWELKDNSWSGALQTLEDIENSNKEDELMALLEDVFMDSIPTETEVNDFLWFEREYIYEQVGLNKNGELPTVFDEIEENTLVNELDLENMKEAAVFSESILLDLKEQINNNSSGLGYLFKKDIETEEQAEWIRDNL